jgi:hypothetical protein
MPNTIRLRRGSTVPSAGSFQEGEPAWDSTNSKLYIKNAAGSMVEIGGAGGGANCAEDTFTGNGTTTNWTMSRSVSAAANVLVSVTPTTWSSPEILLTSAYTVSGTTLTISPAVASGSAIRVLHLLGRGPAGPAANIVNETLDFGSNPQWSAMFTVTTVAATVGQDVIMVASGENGDELEMDGFTCSARVTATNTIQAWVTALPGPVAGTRIFQFLLS